MTKDLFHGSEHIIEKPQYGLGKVRNDYGRGFYCTESMDMAREWASSKDHDGFMNCYTLNMEGLSVLDLNSSEYTVLHWLAVLLENRVFDITSALAYEAKRYLLENFSTPYKEYDIISGNRADDSYFSFAQDFINGTIPVRTLANAMKLGKLGTQVVLKSPKAFEAIDFSGYESVKSKLWFPKKDIRDKEARRQYFSIERNRYQKGDIYMVQILNEEIKANDPRLR